MNAGMGEGQLDHDIQLSATDFIVVAETFMGSEKQRLDRREITRGQGLYGLLDAEIFRDDVAAAAIKHVR
jgi:hypothetical protein